MLHVHRAERADALVGALRELLAAPPADPFAPEVVAVPTRGMERWLTQRMAARLGATPGRTDGVCANVRFPPPRRLVGDAVAAASGIAPEEDPWLPERMVWPLLDVVDASLLEPWAQPLAAYLGGTAGDPSRRARRFATVRHLAELYDRYALYRPQMLHAWAEGADAPSRWQAELWRRLAERLGVPGPAERLEQACAALRAQPELADLPQRCSLFGLTRLPVGRLRVLEALAEHRDVHLFLLHPSPALWRQIAATTPMPGRRADDPTAQLPTNRLLASWGQDSRELQLVLGAHTSHRHQVEAEGSSLLERLQHDVREDRAPEAAELAPGDRSVQVHACHGRARQVEVLRDAILHLLDSNPGLEPRDVLVMCPDIETFAPLIQATFGAAPQDDGSVPAERRPPDLRVRLADRSIRQTNPLLGLVARLLELAAERVTASQVADLAAREPVRRRFRLDDQQLGRLEAWIRASGIRWGFDEAHREPFKLGEVAAGTWRAGLTRVLLGVAMSEDERRLFGDALPLDDVGSGDIDLAGRFAELLARLQHALARLSGPQPIAAWAEALDDAADALAAPGPGGEWQRWELRRLLDDVVEESAGSTTPLALPEVRALLAERLEGRPTRASFRTGHLTICTLMPMRSVPHRVVCLLGLDDGVFPRKRPRDGDDLLLADPHVGDRDARAEDRQLLLDALMAAEEHLIVTYTGNDERTNIATPPAVPVGELLDMIDRTAGPDARGQVVTRHPLQPFDARNFAARRPWSFDRTMLEGAVALAGERSAPAPFLSAPLPAPERDVVELTDLVAFLRRPVREFLVRRLEIDVGTREHEVEDALTVELEGLARYELGQRLLEARLDGIELRPATLAELRRGTLPPRLLAKRIVHEVRREVEAIVAYRADEKAEAIDVDVTLPDGRRVSGTVSGVRGLVLQRLSYAQVNARERLEAWVRLLALTAAAERPYQAMTIGRARGDVGTVTIAGLRAVEPAVARRELAALLDVYERGMREPLPLAAVTSAAYAEQGEAAARAAWESAWRREGEDVAPEHVLVHGRALTFDELLADPPRPDEAFCAEAEPTRFGRYARRVWSGLLAHERVESR